MRTHQPYIPPYVGESPRVLQFEGAPSSGTNGTLVGYVEPGNFLFDTLNGVLFCNEGTLGSPYYTPVGFDQRPLFGVHTDFRDGAGKADANTDAEAVIPGSGLRVFGDGIVETDSGLVVQAAGEGGRRARLTANAADTKVAAVGMRAGVMQPDQHQLLVLDTLFTNVSAITLRALFCGFLGTAADGLVEAITGATTTLTLVQDDLAGLFMDVGLTDGDRLFAPHNKSDEAASIATTAAGVDTGQDMPAAATDIRLRVEISAAGVMTCFANKVQITQIAAALDVDEECSPVLYLASTSAAVKSIDVAHFAAYAYR